MSQKYSKQELIALKNLVQNHGSILYVNDFDIEQEFYNLTGVKRKSGPLYMAAWRLENGRYDHILI